MFTMESPVSLNNDDLDVGTGHRDRKKKQVAKHQVVKPIFEPSQKDLSKNIQKEE